MIRGFTGRHMWAVMIGFFGLVIGVNFTMAWFASSTFGGTVVDNSYVASQKFNGWLQAARTQEKLGWTAQLGLDGGRRVTLAMTGPDSAAGNLFAATGTAHHPLGRAADVPLLFTPAADGGLKSAADGRLHSAAALPGGRWLVRVTVSRDGKQLRLAQTLQ
ncbi:MAG: FixH family protein [Sandarakinorhabdus sp.]|nr:FixH family protein [Sandarakinorhabdus sp.]